jgi:hypothetical protein
MQLPRDGIHHLLRPHARLLTKLSKLGSRHLILQFGKDGTIANIGAL